MVDWPTVIASFAGSATAAAILGWSTQRLIEHWIAKETHRSAVRFSKLHEKRAEVLAEIYRRLSNIDMAFRSLPKEEQEVDLAEHQKRLDFMLHEMTQAGIYFRNHALYFQPELKAKLDKYLHGTLVFVGMSNVIVDGIENHETLKSETKQKALNMILPAMVKSHREVGPLLIDVEREFRKILEG